MKFLYLILLYTLLPFSTYSQNFEINDTTKIYSLNGIWKFSTSDKQNFAQPEFNDSNWQSIYIPGLWRKFNLENVNTGWYRNSIYISEHWNNKKISILPPSFIDAHEFYFNGIKIGEEGKIDSSGKCIVNNSRSKVYHVPESIIKIHSINTLAIRVCNYSGFAGTAGRFHIGESQKIEELYYRSMVWNVSIGFVFFFVSIFHFILFIGSNKDINYLYFSIASLFSSMLTIGYFRFTYWIVNSYWFHFYVFNSGFGMFILFLVLFVYSFFEYKIPQWVRSINFLIVCIFIVFMFSSFSTAIFKLYVLIGQPVMLFSGLPYSYALVSVILKAKKEKKQGSIIVGAGLFVLILAFLIGFLFYFNLFPFMYFLPESYLVFILCIAIALSSRIYGINDQLLLMEKRHSEELEKKIRNRTIDLEEAKKTAEIETGIAWIAQRESQEEKEKTEKLLKEIQKDMLTAKKIQRNILPQNLEKIKELNISSLYKPISSVGGDYFNIEEIKQGLVRVFIADATGHGVQAALITMAIKSEYESVKDIVDSPSKILKFLNENFFHNYKSLNIFFTAFIVDIDTHTGKIKYSSAGHVPQILICENRIQILSQRGNIIGMLPNVEYDEEETDFNSGRLYLVTDGIEEEFNIEQIQFGEERVAEILYRERNVPIQKTLEILYNEMYNFVNTVKIRDDITIIGIEYKNAK